MLAVTVRAQHLLRPLSGYRCPAPLLCNAVCSADTLCRGQSCKVVGARPVAHTAAAATGACMSKRAMVRIGTHSGSFHCDEALGCWMLRQTSKFKDADIVRTRDPEVLKDLDVVIDVGGKHRTHAQALRSVWHFHQFITCKEQPPAQRRADGNGGGGHARRRSGPPDVVLPGCRRWLPHTGVYDPETLRFDHHQRSFETKFGQGFEVTKLSSAGLVYKHYGREVIAVRGQLCAAAPCQDRLHTPLPADRARSMPWLGHVCFAFVHAHWTFSMGMANARMLT